MKPHLHLTWGKTGEKRSYTVTGCTQLLPGRYCYDLLGAPGNGQKSAIEINRQDLIEMLAMAEASDEDRRRRHRRVKASLKKPLEERIAEVEQRRRTGEQLDELLGNEKDR